MSRKLLTLSLGAVLSVSAASAAYGQQTVTTTTKKTDVVQNADGTYTGAFFIFVLCYIGLLVLTAVVYGRRRGDGFRI